MIIMNLRCTRFSRNRSNNKISDGSNKESTCCLSKIQWEVRPGGMLVQKRGSCCGKLGDDGGGYITVRVFHGDQWHNVLIQPTSTFEKLKVLLSMVTSLEPTEQRLVFRGKEREDNEHLHMVGVGDKDKVLLLQDPAIKERKKRNSSAGSDRVSTFQLEQTRFVP